jgi:hypothetical protein
VFESRHLDAFIFKGFGISEALFFYSGHSLPFPIIIKKYLS